MRTWVTVSASLTLLAFAALVVMSRVSLEPLETLRYPAESAGRMVDRHLAFYEGYTSVSPWERGFHDLLFGTRTKVESEALQVYREILQFFEEHPDEATPWAVRNTRSRLLVALGETRPWPELERALSRMEDNPEELALRAAIRYAYENPPPRMSTQDVSIGASLMPRGWAADRVRMRIASRSGEDQRVSYQSRRLLEDGARLRQRTLLLAASIAILIGLGLVTLLRGRRLPGRPAAWQTGILEQPWSLHDGFAVAVRSSVFALIIVLGLGLMAGPYFRPGVLSLWSSLFAALPMLWLMHRHLLRPRHLGFVQAYGLTLSGVKAGEFLRITLVVLAVEWTGSLLIAWTSWKLNLDSHWSEGLHDRLIFGPWETTLFNAIDVVVWGPIAEEIGFRGLVYVALRSRFKPLVAAVLSAGLFSSLHFYSFPGFLAVFWSGLVFALAFERFRSLLPIMLVHSAGNALSLSTVLLFYR